MKFTRLFIAIFLISFLVSCTYMTQGFMAPKDRGAKTTTNDIFGDTTEQIVYLDQNWGAADSLWFYNTTQGSDLIEYDLFIHLEAPDSQELFRSDDNMRRYRYLVQRATWDNPDALPVGLVKDTHRGTEYLGFTCAACHTAQVNYQGIGIRIDGGPTLSYFIDFQKGLLEALKTTVDNDEKLRRMSLNIYGDSDPDTLKKLKTRLQERYQKQKLYVEMNTPLKKDGQMVAHGYGRLDAFGGIYNRVLSHLTPNDPSNSHPPTAPVSYPFLWDTPAHDFVQWNGVGDNYKTGALGRNVGEVLGVFGTMELKKREGDKGFRSSLDVRNIVRLEHHLGKLWSPKWPEDILPAINQSLAERGRQVFVDYHCHDCHKNIDRTDPDRLIIAQMSSLKIIQTDSAMAVNALTRTGNGGYFIGMNDPLKEGEKIPEVGSVLPLVQIAGQGVVAQPDEDKPAIWRGILRIVDVLTAIKDNRVKNNVRYVDFEHNDKPAEYLMSYKARPLNGIWATAPYLHNGSVPNLYSLFLPSCSDEEISQGKKCRPNTFTVGSREFDPINVGFINPSSTTYPDIFTLDTSLPGNSNKGHEYAVGRSPLIKLDNNGKPMKDSTGNYITYTLPPLNEEDRIALVEYLKTL